MSRVPRAATSRDQGPWGHLAQSRSLRDPPVVMVGTGDAPESVVDPDMVALFNEFLGEEILAGPTVTSTESHAVSHPYHYVVRDTEQRALCLQDGHLVATSLQGANAAQEEHISVVPNPNLERQRCPLIVGIRGGTKALSCGTGPEPQLELEDVGLLDLFSRAAEATPYTFYKTFGGTTHTFESAAFPGRFLSTSPGPMLALAAPPAVTAFYLRRK